MGNSSSSLIEPFSQYPIDVGVQRSWFVTRRWRDSSGENSTLRVRPLRSCPKDFLVTQESTIAFGYGKPTDWPLRNNGKVIVIAPHIIQFQETLSMMMTVHSRISLVEFIQMLWWWPRDSRQLQYHQYRQFMAPCPRSPLPRRTLGTQYDKTRNESGIVRRLDEADDADVEADIVSLMN